MFLNTVGGVPAGVELLFVHPQKSFTTWRPRPSLSTLGGATSTAGSRRAWPGWRSASWVSTGPGPDPWGPTWLMFSLMLTQRNLKPHSLLVAHERKGQRLKLVPGCKKEPVEPHSCAECKRVGEGGICRVWRRRCPTVKPCRRV